MEKHAWVMVANDWGSDQITSTMVDPGTRPSHVLSRGALRDARARPQTKASPQSESAKHDWGAPLIPITPDRATRVTSLLHPGAPPRPAPPAPAGEAVDGEAVKLRVWSSTPGPLSRPARVDDLVKPHRRRVSLYISPDLIRRVGAASQRACVCVCVCMRG